MTKIESELAVMEQIAMYMTALPCPPLPVTVLMMLKKPAAAAEEDEDDVRRMPTSSHDLLAGLLIAAMTRGDAGLNAQRRTKQLAITDRLITELEGIGEKLRLDAAASQWAQDTAYCACQQFTADYIHSFDDPGHPAATMQFVRMEEVPLHSHVHAAACSWHAAQDIQHAASVEQRRTAAHFATQEYPSLILEHLRRVTA